MKKQLGEVLPCCFSDNNDQRELNVILAPFHKYCGLELSIEKEHQIKEELDGVLSEEETNQKSTPEDFSRQFRKKWRNRRIEIYDHLLYLALVGPNGNQDLWIEEQKWTNYFYIEATLKLEPKRFYTYLVDRVHEDEEIMFKFYCFNNGEEKRFKWRKDVPWLAGSIFMYSENVTNIVFEELKDWKDGDQPQCNELVEKAKKRFVEKLSDLHGRCFKTERNWRNRARYYYLLGLSRYTGIADGRFLKFKNFDYEGPYCRLVREMIIEDKDLLDQESKQDLPLVCKTKHGKQKNGSFLGHLTVDRLLAWASAANDLGFVKVLLEHYLDNVKLDSNFDFIWEKSIGESWAMALWNASYKGHARIVKELLSWKLPYALYYSEHFCRKIKKLLQKSPHKLLHEEPNEPPLHIAVLKMDVSVIDAFCASPHLNCNEKNSNGCTPLEIVTKLKIKGDENSTIHRKILNLLLQRQEVKDAVNEASSQRQLAVDFSNAIMVGGTLIASITFAGWLSPPLGYNSYYQLVDTTAAAPPDSYESYMAVQGHLTIQLFAIFNSLSFYFAIASVIAGMETFGAIRVVEDTYAIKTVKKLRHKLTWATNLFLTSVVCVLAAFSCAGIAILPPIKNYQTNMYITTAIGGFVCVIFICKMVWYTLSKKFRNDVKLKLHPIFNIWKQ